MQTESTKHIRAASILLARAVQCAAEEQASEHRILGPLTFAYNIVSELRYYSTLGGKQ